MDYTKRKNLNRGYMKLEAWQRGMDLFVLVFRLSDAVSDFKLKSQFRDAAQSISANIAEGYGRRSLPEYIQYLYIAKGSLAESLTRAIGLKMTGSLSVGGFEEFDTLHYEVENKLLRLIESLEEKRDAKDWNDKLAVSPKVSLKSAPIPLTTGSLNGSGHHAQKSSYPAAPKPPVRPAPSGGTKTRPSNPIIQ